MKKLILAVTLWLSFSALAMASIITGHAVTGAQITANGGVLDRVYHNAPITMLQFSEDLDVRLLLGGGGTQSIAGTLPEYYWLTNSGDATRKPNAIIKLTRTDANILDTSTGLVSKSITLKFGETGVFSQEFPNTGSPITVNFTRYNASGGAGSIPPATANKIGGILSSGDITVDSSGKPSIVTFNVNKATFSGTQTQPHDVANKLYVDDSIANALKIPALISGPTGGKQKLQIAMFPSGSGHQSAPAATDPASQYLMLGGTEYAQNSVRGIGFGYVGTNEKFAPAFIGYQETQPNNQTNGDLIFSTRLSSAAVQPMVRLRISSTGDITGENNYVPTNPQSLSTKKYVDNAIAAAINYGTSGSTVITAPSGAVPSNFYYNQAVVLGNGVKNLSAQSIDSLINSYKHKIGEQFYIVGQSAGAVKVTTVDTINGQEVTGKTFNVYPGDVVLMKIDSATAWRMWYVRKETMSDGATGSAPSYLGADRAGYRFFNTTTKKTAIWSGSGWVNSEGQTVTP